MMDATPTMAEPAALSPSRLRPLLLATFGLIVLFAVGFWGFVAWSDRNETLHHAREQAQGTARLLQEHVRRSVNTGDLALARVLDQIRTHGIEGLATNRAVWETTHEMVENLPEIAAVWVHGADGGSLLTSRQYPTPSVNVSDRAYFQAHAAGADFHVGERIVGRHSGQLSFTVSRRIMMDGRFRGVIHANVEIDYYRQLFESLDLGAGASIALFRSDGTPVLRLPAGEPLEGEDGREALRRATQAATETFEVAAPVAGGLRVVSYQRVPSLPLVAVVGLSKDTELAAWHERTIRSGVLVALAVLACAGLAYAAARSLGRESVGLRRLAEANADLDATARRLEEANRAFATANRRMNLILQSASDSICGVDRAGQITFANPAACALTGYGKDEMLGRSLHALIHHSRADGSPYPVAESPVTEVLHSGETRRGLEDTYWTRSGQPVTVEFTASPMLEDGRVEGAVVVFHEIAERKKAEEAMQSARLAAELASRSKSEFLANMSHEIRTPMNAILGLIHLLRQTELSARQADYVQKVRVSAQSLLGILNDILDFSKVEAGKMELERVDFRLDELLQNLAVIIGSAAQEKDIEVLFAVAPDVPLDLVGDPLRLQQVLINLAGNAIKFTDAGEVVVSVRPKLVAADHAVLTFSVRDTGIGIAPEQRERLFQAFSQGDSSTTRRFGGTGLGLAICTRLVGLMGGSMDVDSAPGQGSDFHFDARFDRRPYAAVRTPAMRPLPRDLSVLVVDDNATARAVLAEIAQTFGWSVTACRDAPAALEELERAAAGGAPYDVVLMDWKMPGMDGMEAARRIRADSSVGAPMIIVISGYGRERVGARFEEIGIAGFLVKPVTPSTLLDAVTVAYAEPAGKAGPEPSALAAPAAGSGPALSGPGWDASRVLRGRRLLLVEDNVISQEVAREILERAGARVTTAGTGRQALDRVRQAGHGFDAVLMDVQMPDMDGFEATAAIRALPGGSGLPIIAMTASALPVDRQRCLDHGMNDHVPKPFDLQQLFDVLARWVGPPLLTAAPAGASLGGPPPSGSPLSGPPPAEAAALRPDGLPDRLPGIDLTDALNRLDGDADLLRRFVAEFARSYGGVADAIATALDGGDLSRAKAISHELKSVAGNVGARRLSAAADTMQVAAFQGDAAGVAGQLPVLRAELSAVLESARLLDATPSAATPEGTDAVNSSLDRVALEAALPQFATLLQDSNFAAAEEFAILSPLLADWVDPSTMKGLSSAIDSLDFTKALGIVQRIARELGLSTQTV
ncbi:PAS domain S-box-containing protein [Azospirillum agricola]|uniref:response regulator n=1 Tax=Azospirillum agricola TaxID=1720247 RepID=UPI001AE7D3CC|nr:response regulator [Azospirillum agricola]MBP2230278.1 PAS domain S-box-containing protein [Azospirillum agricola]